MARRKKFNEGGANHERWLVSYADFITLLFAFFVVMFALSEMDRAKIAKANKSFRFALDKKSPGGDTSHWLFFFAPNAMLPFGELEPTPDADRNQLTTDERLQRGPLDGPGDPGYRRKPEDLDGHPRGLEKSFARPKDKRLRNELHARLVVDEHMGKVQNVAVDVVREGVRVKVISDALFMAATTRLHPDAWSVLADIADSARDSKRQIRIAGFETDDPNQPGSPWSLSTFRASKLARLFTERAGVPPARLHAVGHASTSIESNPMHRRYEIVFLRPEEK